MERRTEIVYFDDNDHIVDESVATHAIIRELDENGNLLNETFMIKKSDTSQSQPREQLELSQQDIDFIKSFGLKANIDDLNIKVR